MAEKLCGLKKKGAGNVTMDLLWENQSPLTAFANQKVALDLSKYDCVGIVFNESSGDTLYASMLSTSFTPNANIYYGLKLAAKNITNYIEAASSQPSSAQRLFIRQITTDDTGITFGNAYMCQNVQWGPARTDICIPYQIYGIKGITLY